MKIYTSYFARLNKLPKNIIPISICGKAPDWYKGIRYKVLAPKYSFFQEWKQNQDNQYYIEHFYAEVLNNLNAEEVVKRLSELSGGNDVALICYEKSDDFCHRHLVADWLTVNGYKTIEYGLQKAE